ncbi:MAG: hypothetical protein KDB68_00805 [Planctomycetes bacterium]|nr:hypothetical protein [Planctomycetota bacterium]MCA8946550.1 hypothetical protein [Planctomycetota bacterium]
MYGHFGFDALQPRRDWRDIAAHVRHNLQPQEEYWVAREEVQAPESFGFTESVGAENEGVLAHWRMPFEDGPELHVREFASGYLVHWDRYQLSKQPLMHLIHDAPGWVKLAFLFGAGFLGGAIAAALSDDDDDE